MKTHVLTFVILLGTTAAVADGTVTDGAIPGKALKLTNVKVLKKSVQPRKAMEATPSANTSPLIANTTAPAAVKTGGRARPQLLADNDAPTTQGQLKGRYGQEAEGVSKAPQPETPAEFQRFHFRLRSYNAMDLVAAENNGGGTDHEVRVWERLDGRYNFTPTFNVAIMPQFYHTWFGAPDRTQSSSTTGLDQSYSFYMGDTSLILNSDELYKLNNDFVISGYLRYDLPTSEQSQKNNQVGAASGKLVLARKFGRLGFELSNTYIQYIQQYTSSTLVDSKTNLPVQNLNYQNYSVLDTTYKLTSWLGLFFETGWRNQMRYADGTTNRAQVGETDFIINPELDFTLSKNVELDLGIFEMPNASVFSQQYTPLTADPKNANEAYLMATLQF